MRPNGHAPRAGEGGGTRGRGPLGSRSNYAGPRAPEEMPGYAPPMLGPIPREGRIARGARLSSEAFAVISKDRGLLTLALGAMLTDLLIGGAFLGGALTLAGHADRRLYVLVAILLASYPLTVVGTFFNVALQSTVARRWTGEPASVMDGVRVARSRMRVIVMWSVIAATVGSVMSLAERFNHFAWLERLLAYLAGAAWSVATFFVIPALAADGVGPREALRRSVRTVRERWAESMTGTVAIGGATGLLLLPGLLIAAGGYQAIASEPAIGFVLLMTGTAAALPVMVYSNATSAVFTLAVYRHTQGADGASPFGEADLASPFIGARKGSGKIRTWLGGRGLTRAQQHERFDGDSGKS